MSTTSGFTDTDLYSTTDDSHSEASFAHSDVSYVDLGGESETETVVEDNEASHNVEPHLRPRTPDNEERTNGKHIVHIRHHPHITDNEERTNANHATKHHKHKVDNHPRHENAHVRAHRRKHHRHHNAILRGHTHHRSAKTIMNHHHEHPYHGGRHDERDMGFYTTESRLVVTKNGIRLSIPNMITGERTLHHVKDMSQPVVVLHEDHGTDALTMLSPTVLKSISRILAPNGKVVMSGEDLRLTPHGQFQDNKVQEFIGGPQSTIFDYLDHNGLQLVPHSELSSDLSDSAHLHRQQSFSLVLEHSDNEKAHYPRDEDGGVILKDVGEVREPFDNEALDAADKHARVIRNDLHVTPNEETHNNSVQNLHDNRLKVQDALQKHHTLVNAGLVGKTPEDAILNNWNTRYMVHFGAVSHEDNELASSYDRLKREIEHSMDMGNPSSQTLEVIRKEAMTQGGMLNYFWNQFSTEFVKASLTIFREELGKLSDKVKAKVESNDIPDITQNDYKPPPPPPPPAAAAANGGEASGNDWEDQDHQDLMARIHRLQKLANPDYKPRKEGLGKKIEEGVEEVGEKIKTGVKWAANGVRKGISKLENEFKGIEHKVRDKVRDFEKHATNRVDADRVMAHAKDVLNSKLVRDAAEAAEML